MIIPLEELLNLLCPGATATRSNELQKAFLIPDAVGAKLAYEVLTAHGFEAKLYPDASAMKLYVTLPQADGWEERFAMALTHALALANIRRNLDPATGMTFVNAPGGKQ